ncbi:MAG: hypothetical protein ABEJ56_06270 [Candidatus Nanohaloarchaea archaeon]
MDFLDYDERYWNLRERDSEKADKLEALVEARKDILDMMDYRPDYCEIKVFKMLGDL